jgi:hypothetical protein
VTISLVPGGQEITPFFMDYPSNTQITLMAPLFAGGNAFSQWRKDGEFFSFNHIIVINIDELNITLTAVYSGPRPCLHPKTLVTINKEGKQVNIDSLRGGDTVLDHEGNLIKIKKNIRFDRSNEFILIRKQAISVNSPSTDLLIRKGHPILYNGKKLDCAKLVDKIGNDKVMEVRIAEHVPVWSLATDTGAYVMTSGVPVKSWRYSELLEQSKFSYDEY